MSGARTLFEQVVEGASRVPGAKLAVAGKGSALSFEALLRGARGVATSLAEAGVGRGDRVGVWMDKSPRCVQVLLGILASGAAYVALDPRSPPPRCRAILEDCGLAGLAVDAPKEALLAQVLPDVPPRWLCVDARSAGTPSGAIPLEQALTAPESALPSVAPEDLAYLLYTSGSTGRPKGVVHTHASALAFVHWVQRTFAVRPEDVFSSHAPFHFDLSISDLYASLGSGASVRLISAVEGMVAPYLVRSISEWGITIWYSVPSCLISMLETGGLASHGLPTVRTLLFAGEVFPTPQLRRLRKAVPHAELVNLFGPTETNVCTYYRVPAELPDDDDRSIPIGRGCEHMETFVLTDEGREAAPGEEGTLWAREGNVMAGYWNDPERSSATLRPDPRGRPGLAYCTGDRVRELPSGDYQFLGRRDHLVKTRGYRVELGEVECALAAHPQVREAVVVPLPDPKLGHRLVASVARRAGAVFDPEVLRAFCQERLPLYMVPHAVEVRDELPRTSTGKADRTALRAEWEQRMDADGGWG